MLAGGLPDGLEHSLAGEMRQLIHAESRVVVLRRLMLSQLLQQQHLLVRLDGEVAHFDSHERHGKGALHAAQSFPSLLQRLENHALEVVERDQVTG